MPTSRPVTALDHARGAIVALFAAAVLILGFPGLDLLHPSRFKTEAQRRQARAAPLGELTLVLAAANARLRQPVVDLLTPLQQPLRIAQAWSLYANGPQQPHRLEILADGQLLHRTNDPAHPWLEATLAYRRLRPIGPPLCVGTSKVERGMLAWLVVRARDDHPELGELVVRCTQSPWHTADPEHEQEIIRYTLSAPDFKVRRELP